MTNTRMPIAINRIKIMLLTTNNKEVSINDAVILWPEKDSNTQNKFLCSVPLDFRQKVKKNPSTTNFNNNSHNDNHIFLTNTVTGSILFHPKNQEKVIALMQ